MKFIADNSNWFIALTLWSLMSGLIVLFADAPTPHLRKVKRIVGVLFITFWIWGVTISGVWDAGRQSPHFQQHISPPDHWWKCSKN